MRKVLLWDMEGVVLILMTPSGITYSNQTGGTACFQDEEEGVLVPVYNGACGEHSKDNLRTFLSKYLFEVDGLTEEQANKIDEHFGKMPVTSYIKVNRSKLKLSREAWIYVEVFDSKMSNFEGFETCEGVISWPNSD